MIENVRGLLSARAARPEMQGATPDERNPADATVMSRVIGDSSASGHR